MTPENHPNVRRALLKARAPVTVSRRLQMVGNRKCESARVFRSLDLGPLRRGSALRSGFMDRYLLLVLWGDGKVPAAASAEPESPSLEGPEKRLGKSRALLKERERAAQAGKDFSA